MAVLILAPPEDVHVQAVAKQLRGLDVKTYCGSLGGLVQQANFSLRLENSDRQCRLEPLSDSIWGSTTGLDLAAVSAVWLRRPGRVKALKAPEPWAAGLIECESNRAVQGFLRTLPALWINHPTAQSEAAFKVRQLTLARFCGLAIPKTLITNNPAEVQEFYESCNGEIVYKLIDELSWEHFPAFEVPKGIPTLPFRQSDLKHLEQVRLGLHLFQERVDKLADIRVTVVGRQMFPVKIDLLKGKSHLDFRLDYSVPMEPHQLPVETADKCLALMETLGLNFGAFDFCLARDGQYVFLEVNAAGQWLWMETGLDLPISLALARLLAGLDPPIVAASA